MLKKAMLLGLIVLWAGMSPAAQEKIFTYDYTFKPGSEPKGFRGINWQTDISTLNPFQTMRVLEITGPFVYYQKNREDLRLGLANVEHIIYEFWNGKFFGVIITVKGDTEFQRLKDYCFARFGPGQRSKVYESLNVQDYYYNGLKTRMTLKFSDIDRVGTLSLYSIAILSKQTKNDSLYFRERAQDQIKEWQKN